MTRFYAIYDNSLKLSNAPFACSDDKSAVRMVRNMLLSSPDDVFKRVAPCCDLLFVGTFDNINAVFIPESDKVLIVSLADIPIPDDVGGNS